MAQPDGVLALGASRRSTRCSRTGERPRRSSSASTPGPRSAAASSSTRRAPAATTPTCATRSCRSSTPTTERWPIAAHRGIAGKSSGGYGAMVTPMLRPDLFGGLATHAGDALFEVCYLPDVPAGGPGAARPLRRLVRRLLGRLPLPPGRHQGERRPAAQRLVHGRLLLDRCGRHGPAAVRLRPPAGWCPRSGSAGWRWDPVRMVAGHADALRGLRAIWVDAGTQRRVLPRPRRGGVRRPSSPRSGSASRSCASSCSTARTAESSGATRRRSAGSRSGWRPRPGNAPRGGWHATRYRLVPRPLGGQATGLPCGVTSDNDLQT